MTEQKVWNRRRQLKGLANYPQIRRSSLQQSLGAGCKPSPLTKAANPFHSVAVLIHQVSRAHTARNSEGTNLLTWRLGLVERNRS